MFLDHFTKKKTSCKKSYMTNEKIKKKWSTLVDDLVQIRWIVCLFFFLNVIHSCVFKLLFAPFNRANNVTFWSAFECVPVLLAEWLYIQTIKYSVSALYPVIINTPKISCGEKKIRFTICSTTDNNNVFNRKFSRIFVPNKDSILLY